MTKHNKFTEAYLKKLSRTCPQAQNGRHLDRKYYSDSDTTGLYFYVRCLANGKFSCKWVFRMQESARIHRPLKAVLGTYPDMKYLEARLKALSILSKLYDGTSTDDIKQNINNNDNREKITTLSGSYRRWCKH